MKHTYVITGMSCQGCRSHVAQTLSNIRGVEQVEVDLEQAEATIEMQDQIELSVLKKAMEKYGGRYDIDHLGNTNRKPARSDPNRQRSGTYYCPMQCEGDKIYDRAGDCPVCGMDLVEQVSLSGRAISQYICPMHPGVESDGPGTCHHCGMDMVTVQAEPSDEDMSYRRLRNKLWIATAFTVPIFIIAMSEMLSDNPLYRILDPRDWNMVQLLLSLPVVFYATWMFFQRAFRSIRTWNLNMFTLIGMGAGIAWAFSVFALLFPHIVPAQFKTEAGAVHVYFEAAAVILTLVLLGQVLEARAHMRTSSAIKGLLELAPHDAFRVRGDKEEKVPIDQIVIGDTLRVKPGGKIAVDGQITEGNSSIDESMITGEPLPIDKGPADQVHSGTINGQHSFLMRAEKVGADTLLSHIIKMVHEASRSRAPIQKLADQVSSYFVPMVVLISVVTFIAWVMVGPQPAYVYAMVNAIAVLIIACPCALGLATPMSVMVGVGKGAQNGVLIKHAEALEKLSQVDTLVIDKTGTLTEGKPSVEYVGSAEGRDQMEVMQYIASANQHSEHPLATSVMHYAEKLGLRLWDCKDFQAVTGKGVEAIVRGEKVTVGNERMMHRGGVTIPDHLEQKAMAFQRSGKTVSYLAVGQDVAGYVVIGDKIKQSTHLAVASLHNLDITIIMLTGDNRDTAASLCRQLKLSDFQAEMLPEEKMEAVQRLQQDGKVVAMAGDGINDAPALAQSDVGIAMGTGTDVAIESADITLVNGNLQGIVRAINLSGEVMKNIKQNLFFALIYNTIGVPIAAGVLYPFFGILLSPMIAALAMSFSSVSVIGNALRLRSKKI